MALLYYLVKIAERYDYSKMMERKAQNIKNQKCRVCLEHGVIPIYGIVNTPDLLKALQIFCDIQDEEDDEFPKYLCTECNNFITEAILFRKKAKQTEKILKLPLDTKVFDPNDFTSDIEQSKPNYINQDIKSNIKPDITTNGTKVTCKICNKVLARSYYKDHMTKHDPNCKKYVCEVCGKIFCLYSQYYNHSLIHKNYFPYKCPDCPYRGRSSTLLKSHMHTHTRVRKYKCTVCPARYITKSNLGKHMRQHNEPQIRCDSCDKLFHTQYTRKRHCEAVHLGIRSHICNICTMVFSRRKTMREHQLSIHKVEKLPFGNIPSYLKVEYGKQEH